MSENLLVPYGVLARYPLSLPTLVAALWWFYVSEQRDQETCLEVGVARLLERLGKPYSPETVRELTRLLYEIYVVQKVGFRIEPKDGVETLTLWLTPETMKRIKIYRQQVMETA